MWHRVPLVEVEEDGEKVRMADHRLGQVSESFDYGVIDYDVEKGECVIAVAIHDDDEECSKLVCWEQLGHVRSRIVPLVVRETRGRGKKKRVVREETVLQEIRLGNDALSDMSDTLSP